MFQLNKVIDNTAKNELKGINYSFEDLGNAIEKRGRMVGKVIYPQIRLLDQYMDALAKSKRFTRGTGPLYDPVNGWNPYYHVQ